MFAKNLLNMKKNLYFLLGLAMLASCGDDEQVDSTAPQILEALVNSEDHDIELNAGEKAALQVEVSDNDELSELKVDIHDLFDGHSHGKSTSTWEMTKIYSLSGATSLVQDSLEVPSPVIAGPYHFVFRLVDASGNESEFKEVEFVVRNGGEAQFNVTSPDFSTEVHAPKGEAFNMEGSITDDQDLAEILIRISEEEEHSHKKSGAPIYEEDIDLTGTNDTSFDLSTLDITIPTTAETGYYKLLISAKDNDGNYGVYEAEIHVM